MAEKSFRKFMEEEEEKGSRYVSSLEDELGIDSRDLEKEPQIASFFSVGGITRNIGPYRILKFKRNIDGDITHAVVIPSNDPTIRNRQYKNKEGEWFKLDNEKETEKFLVPIEDLDKLLSQDFQPPPAPGGDMGGIT